MHMKRHSTILLLTLLTLGLGTQAQEINHVDPLATPIIGFSFGVMHPSAAASHAITPTGESSTLGSMPDLYKSPFLGFGLDFDYKFKNNFLLTLDGNIFFGSDNLKDRTNRMSNVFTGDSIIVGTNGTDAVVTCHNRGLSLKAGIGYIFALNDKNPNSGILTKVNGGWTQNQTIFMINDVEAPQVTGDYGRLYDHQRRGFMLTESVGYIFMSNHKTLVNIYVAFEVSQCWTKSSRDYVIDDLLHLQGPDNNKYFDLIYSLKFCWMFPLSGKPNYDYYYF